MGDVYEGVIASVAEQVVRNPFSAQRERQPVIAFADGWRLIPNLGMRAALIEMLGPETDAWVGRRIQVFRRRVERIDRTTGEVRVVFVKSVSCRDRHARAVVSAAQPEVVVEREYADYDDSPEALAAAATKGRR
jgi:hypothetical protein